jgi:hypothetical protein
MKTKLILAFALITLFMVGCRKEGCTDPDSKTYNSKAKKEDYSCVYEGSVVIWYGQHTASELVKDGVTSLTFTVDGSIVGSTSSSIYWTSAPDCGDNGSITITKNLGNAKNKSYTYNVKDQTGFVYWSGVLNFTANTCFALELAW